MYRIALLICLSTVVATAGDAPTYQKGAVTKRFVAPADSTAQVYYDLQTETQTYKIKICAEFEDGKSVDFRVKGGAVFIRSDAGNEIKCPLATVFGNPVVYKKGTIEGYDTRKDYYASGNGTISARKAKVYELHGADMIYKVDYCGMFQAGQFTAGLRVPQERRVL